MQQACRFRRVAQARPGTAHLARAQYLLLHSSIRCNASASMQQGEQEAPAPSVTIVGAGAAGLTAAFFAAEHGAKVRCRQLLSHAAEAHSRSRCHE